MIVNPITCAGKDHVLNEIIFVEFVRKSQLDPANFIQPGEMLGRERHLETP